MVLCCLGWLTGLPRGKSTITTQYRGFSLFICLVFVFLNCGIQETPQMDLRISGGKINGKQQPSTVFSDEDLGYTVHSRYLVSMKETRGWTVAQHAHYRSMASYRELESLCRFSHIASHRFMCMCTYIKQTYLLAFLSYPPITSHGMWQLFNPPWSIINLTVWCIS